MFLRRVPPSASSLQTPTSTARPLAGESLRKLKSKIVTALALTVLQSEKVAMTLHGGH